MTDDTTPNATPDATGEAAPSSSVAAFTPITTDASAPVLVVQNGPVVLGEGTVLGSPIPEPVRPPSTEELAEQVRREKAKADRTTLMAWLTKLDALYQRGGVLISRDARTASWEQTGFATMKGKLVVKFGTQPYQPMGLIDDTFFYPSDISKLVWIREFAIVQPSQCGYPPAFIVMEGQTKEVDDSMMSERERKAMETAFGAIGVEMERATAAREEGDLAVIKEAEFRLVETVKMAAITCPKVDGKLRKMAVDNKDLATFDANGNPNGFDFTKMDPVMIGRAVSEFTRMILNDDGIHRFLKTSELKPANASTEIEILEQVLSQLNALMPAEGAELNQAEAERQLNNAQTTVPALRDALKAFYDSADLLGALKAARQRLQEIQDRLAKVA